MNAKSIHRITALTLWLLPLGSTTSNAAPPSKEAQQQLLHAIVQNQVDVVETLLKQGGDPNDRVAPGKEDAWILEHRTDADPAPPLIVLACRFGCPDPKVIRLLIEKGADVNIIDENGTTPLMMASELDWDPSVALLLEHGAKVKLKDHYSKTALMYAMGNRGLSTVAKLVEKGAEINSSDKQGKTPLMYAIMRAAHDPIWLLGEDHVEKEKAAKERYIELIQYLIAKRANVNAKDSAGNTHLMLATIQRQPEVVKMLIAAGAKTAVKRAKHI